jgi:hypothetical protein
MNDIDKSMQAAYQLTASRNGRGAEYTGAASFFPPVAILNFN